MAELKAIIGSLSDADENLRGFYVEKDGKYQLNVLPVAGVRLENVEGLLSSLSKERESAKEAVAKLAEFGDMSPKEAREAIFKMKDASKYQPSAKVEEQINAATEALKKAAEDKEAELTSTIDSLTGQLNVALIHNEANAAIAVHKGSPKLLMHEIEKRTDMRPDANGKLQAVVLDANGNPRYADGQGSLYTIDSLVADLKSDPDFAPAFAGLDAKGGGMPPDAGAPGGGRTMSRAQFDALDPQSQADMATADDVTIVD